MGIQFSSPRGADRSNMRHLNAARGLPILYRMPFNTDAGENANYQRPSFPPCPVKDKMMESLLENTPIEELTVGTNLLALARDRRVAAIDAHPRLAYVARLCDDLGLKHEVAFATSAEFEGIEQRTREIGLRKKIEILDVSVRAIKPRPLVLSSWQRIKAYDDLAFAAE